jgi:hypothetical protein
MRAHWITLIFAVMGMFLVTPACGFGQASRCIILEKEGNRALVSCNGKPARYIDLRGKADMYKVGDSIDASDTTLPGTTRQGVKQK